MGDTRSDDIEALNLLKARYFRYLDTKRWADWAELFEPDAVFEIGYHYAEPLVGREAIVSRISASFASTTSLHYGHTPEFVFQEGGRATGVWAMVDTLITHSGPSAGRIMRGYGHYLDHYLCRNGTWRFASIRLTRLHVEISEPVGFTEYPAGVALASRQSLPVLPET